MIKMNWVANKSVWAGERPRCGVGSFFALTLQREFSDGTFIDVVECHGNHPFVICSTSNPHRGKVLFVTPLSDKLSIPSWLPDEYKDAYAEMGFDFNSGKYRSAVALAGIILDAHINSLMKSKLDRRKNLAHRLEILINAGRLDPDQFADGTIVRLSRNEVMHTESIAETITRDDAADTIDAVSSCLERFYKWRRAKALPAPKEQVGEEDAPEKPDGAVKTPNP